MSEDERDDFLRSHYCSAKLAKWIYQNLPCNKPDALNVIAFGDVPWARSFLWSELESHRTTEFGDSVLIALGRNQVAEDADRFIDIYEDETAHSMTRGSAVYCVCGSAQANQWHVDRTGKSLLPESALARIRETCLRAIQDENSYARAGAVWLGEQLGGLDSELAPLRTDRTPVDKWGSLTVADHFDLE